MITTRRTFEDSAGRTIRVGDAVQWRGQRYTIKAFSERIGRFGTRVIEFEEPLHVTDEVPDEFAVDLASAVEPPRPECTNHTPPGFVGHWRDWHRGHGCDKDDGASRSAAAKTEIQQMAENESSGFLTDAELAFLRAATTSGDTLLVRALDELRARRATMAAVPLRFSDSDRLDWLELNSDRLEDVRGRVNNERASVRGAIDWLRSRA
jgi:hypothetical protein